MIEHNETSRKAVRNTAQDFLMATVSAIEGLENNHRIFIDTVNEAVEVHNEEKKELLSKNASDKEALALAEALTVAFLKDLEEFTKAQKSPDCRKNFCVRYVFYRNLSISFGVA